MSVLSGPFHAMLSGAPAVTDKLRTYSGAPAVFVNRTVPGDFKPDRGGKPWLVSDGDDAREEVDLTGKAWIVSRDVVLYDVNDGAPSEIDAAAEAVRELFDAQGFVAVANHRCKVTGVVGPVRDDPLDESVYGRRISVEMFLEEV